MTSLVREERTRWRDLKLNDEHRKWGWNCPAIDIDKLFLEYDKGKAVALIEYKHERAAPQFASHPSYRALVDLGNRAQIPVFAVRYADDFSWWHVIPLNQEALKYLDARAQMGYREYVEFVYYLRGYEVPEDLFRGAEIEI